MIKRICIVILLLACVPLSFIYSQKKNVEIVFLLDNSGSMKNNDPNELRAKILKYIPEIFSKLELKITLFMFDSDTERLGEIDKNTDITSFSDNIQKLDSGGNYTDYAKAFMEALEYLDGSKSSYKAIVLITDGDLEVDPDDWYYNSSTKYGKLKEAKKLLNKSVEAARKRGIPLYPVLLTKRVSSSELKRMARKTGGDFHSVTTKGKLDESFMNLMRALVNISGDVSKKAGFVEKEDKKDDEIKKSFDKFQEENKKKEEIVKNADVKKEETGSGENTNVVNMKPLVITNDELMTTNGDDKYNALVEKYNLVVKRNRELEYAIRKLNADVKREDERRKAISIQYKKAIAHFAKDLKDSKVDSIGMINSFLNSPDSIITGFYFAEYLLEKGQDKKAIALIERLADAADVVNLPTFVFGVMARGYYRGGRYEKLTELYKKLGKKHYLIPYYYGVLQLKLKDIVRAEDLFNESIRLEDNYFASHYNLGIIHYRKKDYRKAYYEFVKSWANKREAKCAFMVGNSAYKLGDEKNALLYYNKALLENPGYINAYYNLAVHYIKKQDYITGQSYVHTALRHSPKNGELLLLNAYVYYFAEKYWQAYANFNTAYQSGIKTAGDGVVLSLLSSGEIKKAEEFLQSISKGELYESPQLLNFYFALNLSRKNIAPLNGMVDVLEKKRTKAGAYLLGNYFLIKGDKKKAVGYLKNAGEYAYSSMDAMEVNSILIESGVAKKDSILKLMHQIVEKKEQTLSELKLVYQYFLSVGEYEYSIDILRKLLIKDGKDSEFYLSLFRIAFPGRDVKNAARGFEKKSEGGKNLNFVFYFSLYRQAMNMPKLAITGYMQVIQEAKDMELIELGQRNLAVCYTIIGEYRKALQLYTALESKYGSDEVVKYNIGIINLNMGKVSVAKYYFELALALRPDFESALFNLFAINLYYDNVREAREYMEKISKLKSKNEALYLYYQQAYYLKIGNTKKAGEIEKIIGKRYPDFEESIKIFNNEVKYGK